MPRTIPRKKPVSGFHRFLVEHKNAPVFWTMAVAIVTAAPFVAGVWPHADAKSSLESAHRELGTAERIVAQWSATGHENESLAAWSLLKLAERHVNAADQAQARGDEATMLDESLVALRILGEIQRPAEVPPVPTLLPAS